MDMDIDNENKIIKEYTLYKEKLLNLLIIISKDSIPIVRRSAIITLGKMINELRNKDEIISKYLPLFTKLAKDEQDNVRVFAVQTLLQFNNILTKQDINDHLIHYIRELCIDKAWRVRYIAADNFIKICNMLDRQFVNDSMLSYYIHLLEDDEPEVRAIAITKIPQISKVIGMELSIQKLIPIIDTLVSDKNKYARASLASIIIPFCHLLPINIVTEHILKCILTILNDDSPNVRLNVISNLCGESNDNNSSNDEQKKDDITMKNNDNNEQKFDVLLLEESIIPSIIELVLNNDWRVRLGIIEKFPLLTKQFSKKFFNDKLFELCLASLEDSVYEIRFASAQNLFKISNHFNNIENNNYKWTKDILIPKLINMVKESNHYLHRIIYLLSFQYLSESLKINNNNILIDEIIYYLKNDKVPNVRFKCAQIIIFLINNNLINKKYYIKLKDIFNYLILNDNDSDVIYFSKKGLTLINK